jgi:hypothetical protein
VSRWRAVLFAALATGVGLLPLFGDPRQSPVTHAEWARLLIRALDLDPVMHPGSQASLAFSTLSWKESLRLPADQYTRADGVETAAGRVRAGEKGGETAYPLSVPRPGDYGVRVKVMGPADSTVQVEVAKTGEVAPVATFAVVPQTGLLWLDAGTTHLDPGNYSVSVLLAAGQTLEAVEVTPPCLQPIEPPGGWRAAAVATTGDVAVTAIEALRSEPELPPADTPILVAADAFQVVTPAAIPAAMAAQVQGQGLQASIMPLQALVFLDIPEDGLYTLASFGAEGNGQSWLADGCSKSVVCPSSATASGPGWHDLLTSQFTRGRHSLTVTLGQGASVGSLRLERKKATPEDYLATLRRIGCDPGPDGQPITRAKALETMSCIAQHRAELGNPFCGDILESGTTVAGGPGGAPFAQPPQIAGPAVPPPPAGPGQPPFGGTVPPLPPDVGTQPPASPTVP